MQVRVGEGIVLEVIDQSSERSAPLLLVHGFGGAKEDFGDHLEELAKDRRVITADLRGHGDSSKPEDVSAYSLDILAADLQALMTELGIERFDLLGHSMGGMVARRMVLQAPERVTGLVLMDTSPGPIPGFDRELIDAGAEIALTQGMDVLKQILDDATPLASGPGARVLETRPGYREYSDWKFSRLSAAMWATMVRELVYQPDELALLGAVDAPTLVMVGEHDDPFRDISQRMAETIPGARFELIPDAGHSPQFENPDAWFAALTRFLAELPSVRA